MAVDECRSGEVVRYVVSTGILLLYVCMGDFMFAGGFSFVDLGMGLLRNGVLMFVVLFGG